MERFACRTMIFSGDDALQALAEGDGNRLAVVTDPIIARSGILRQVMRNAGCSETMVMEDVYPQPTIRQAVEGARKLQAFCPDKVVALGGGNVLDCAKAMRCFAGVEGSLTAIPTEFGICEEVTAGVTLVHDGSGHALRDGRMRPDRVILDHRMLADTSRAKLCEGGFFLLAASVESYTGKQGSIFTRLHAREAFSGAWAALPAAAGGNAQAQKRVLTASVLASMAKDSGGLGLCGAMCGSLEALCRIPRGRLAAILLPAVMGWNIHGNSRGYGELARAGGMGGGCHAGSLKAGLLQLRQELGLPGTLAQAGVDPRLVWNNAGQIVRTTLEDPCCRNNPVTADDFMVRRILEEITGRF